jgi:hypothetical protein
VGESRAESERALRRRWLLACLVVVASVGFISVARLTNAEVFMRMALGRAALSDLRPMYDPFLFSVQAPFANPEWAGDLLLYGCHHVGGETALVALRIVVVSIGALMLLLALRKNGASVGVATLLVSAVVLTTGARWGERNEMHLAWLVPAYLCLLRPQRERLRWLLIPLGIVWANVHGSFVVGWVILFAGVCDAWMAGERKAASQLAIILIVHPLLPLVSPAGAGGYQFVWEHHRHAEWLAQNIAEWLPPSARSATLSEGALHALVLVTLATFLARGNRRAIGRFVLAIAGVAFAYRALRFAPLSAMLLAVACGGNLTCIALQRRVKVVVACGVACFALYVGYGGRTQLAARPHPLSEKAGAAGAARWLGQHARPGSRVFHPFNQSQLLMWFAPQVKLVVTAHTPWIGYDAWQRASTSSVAFEALVERFDVDYVLIYAQAASTAPGFWDYIGRHPRWQRVYSDRYSAVFARSPDGSRP